MDTAFPVRIDRMRTHPRRSPLLAATVAAVVLLVATTLVLLTQHVQAPAKTSAGEGLSAQQIVIRGEVADRLAQSAGEGR